MNIKYYVVSSSGNITALITTEVPQSKYKSICKAIMESDVNIEQVGFVDFSNEVIELNMSGGEFCGNATLSALALASDLKNITADFSIKVSGSGEVLKGKSSKNGDSYYAECLIPYKNNIGTVKLLLNGGEKSFPIIKLDGISHIIVPFDFDREYAEKLIKNYANENNLSALGIMFYDEAESRLVPLVYVRNIDTLFYEKSCASGSCAVAIYNSLKAKKGTELTLSQPGGVISVSTDCKAGYVALSNKIIIEKSLNKEI